MNIGFILFLFLYINFLHVIFFFYCRCVPLYVVGACGGMRSQIFCSWSYRWFELPSVGAEN